MKRSSCNSGAPSSAGNQRDRILWLLVTAQGNWVPSPEIAACAQQYNARLYEIRHLGFVIENKTQTDERTGERCSWFRLVRSSPPPTPSLPSTGAGRDWYEREHGRRPKPERGSAELPLFDASVMPE